MSLAFILFWAGICLLFGAIIYSELCDRCSPDDPFSDGPHGDIAFIAADDIELLHNGGDTK